MSYTNEPEYLVWLPMTKVYTGKMHIFAYYILCKQHSLVYVVGSIYDIISCRLQCVEWTLCLILLQSSSLVC